MSKSTFTLLDVWTNWAELCQLTVETQAVMTMRILGMVGCWPVTSSENSRMISEKGPAFAKAGEAATRAAMAGALPLQILAATVKPLRTKTRANSRRLSKRGFKR